MTRHSDNPNLHLYWENTFEGMQIMSEKGPFILEYLVATKRTIERAVDHYPRVLAFRIDLRFPQDAELSDDAYTNAVISRFIESFKAKIRHDRARAQGRNPCARDSRVRYVWAREVGRNRRPHYHLLILLNRDAYYGVGRLVSRRANNVRRMEEAWASALKLPVDQVWGLVHIPEQSEYRINRYIRAGDHDALPELFHRVSYLCKAATKSFGDRQRGFDTSRG